MPAGFAGSRKTATRLTLGATCLSSSSHLVPARGASAAGRAGATDVDPILVISLVHVGAIAHQAAGGRKFAQLVDCGKRVTGGQPNYPFPARIEEDVGGN